MAPLFGLVEPPVTVVADAVCTSESSSRLRVVTAQFRHSGLTGVPIHLHLQAAPASLCLISHRLRANFVVSCLGHAPSHLHHHNLTQPPSWRTTDRKNDDVKMENMVVEELAPTSSSAPTSLVHCIMSISEACSQYMDMMRQQREEKF